MHRLETTSAADPYTLFSLREVKDLLNVDHVYDDAKIRLAYEAAYETLEEHAWLQLMQATLKLTIPWWGQGRRTTVPQCRSHLLYLPRPPLVSISSVQYYDEGDVLQTLSSSEYLVHTFRQPGAIEFIDDFTAPSLSDRDDAVQITYLAGVTAASSVSAKIKRVLIFLTRLFYEDDSMQSCAELDAFPLAYRRLVRTISKRDERTVYLD